MNVLFDQFIRESADALGMDNVAAVQGARTIPDYASTKASGRVVELIDKQQIDRVEFIRRPADSLGHREYRGAILYDTSSEPEPYLHVLNALLGYQGSGPQLSHSIMMHLGMSSAMFDEMNGSVDDIRSTNQSYVISVFNVGVGWVYVTDVPLVLHKR